MILTAVLFTIYQIFYGLVSFYHSTTVRARGIDLAQLDIKLWLEDTPLAAVCTTSILIFRINGIGFLIYFGYKTEWYYAVGIFVGATGFMAILNSIIRMKWGHAAPSLLGFLVLPVVGIAMWFSI
jgi:hypothetical protein